MRDPNKAAKDWAVWCRKNGFACSSWTAGGVSVDGFRDLRAVEVTKPPEKPLTIFEQYGKVLLEQPATRVDDVPDEAKLDD